MSALVGADRWWTEFSAVIDRIAPRFARYEPLRHAAELMAGMVSGLDRKNCWTIAEHRGNATPDGLQHLLARAKWDADAVRDDVRDYVVDAFGDPCAVLVVDETGDVKRVFWLTTAFMVVVIVIVLTLVPNRPRTATSSIDWLGAAGLALGLSVLLLAITRGDVWGWLPLRTVASAWEGSPW